MDCMSAFSQKEFVSKTCWINGIYVYQQFPVNDTDKMTMFGLPKPDDDGHLNGELCKLTPSLSKLKRRHVCEPLEKTFYLKYQYLPLVFAALAILYYAPYVLFKWLNQDLKSLNTACDGKFTLYGVNFLFRRNISYWHSILVEIVLENDDIRHN